MMTSQEPEKRQELDAMMKRLGLLGIEGKEPRPGGPGGEGREVRVQEPAAPARPSQGTAQADELKDFLRHLETLEKDGAQKVQELSGESDSVMARLEKLDLTSLGEQAQAQKPAPGPARAQEPAQPARVQASKKDDDFLTLIRGIEEVKRDMVPESQARTAPRKEIRAEKLGEAGDAKLDQETPAPETEAEFSTILNRLEKLDLTHVGGETKTDLSDIAAWKKEIRKDARGPAPVQREAASPQPSPSAQGNDTEAILKRLEGLAPEEPVPAAEPKVTASRVKAVPREAVPPQPPKAVQGVDAETILKRLEELSPEEAKAVAQKVAPAQREAEPPQPPQAAQGVDA
ncbi:MAG: hypothetical protein LUP92_01230, partial [Methanomicrobiales archaeon]|nr:hypothetical protein [Methanomicrobiales archaeon]